MNTIVLRSTSAARRAGGTSLLLGLLAVLIFVFGQGAAGALQYDRAAIIAGQWHRLFTAHITHWSGDHLFWDVSMFVALGIVCEQRDRRAFLLTIVASAVLVALAVMVLQPDMKTYRGLSGIDSALFSLLAVSTMREPCTNRPTRLVMSVFLAGFVAKIMCEAISGQTIFVNSSAAHFTPVPLAHIIGAGTGFVIALLNHSRAISATRLPG